MWNLGGDNTEFFELHTTSDANTFTYSVSGLTTGETYQFKVVAHNFIGDSEDSDILSVIAATVPLQPQAPVKVSADQGQITIRWVAAVHETGSTSLFDGGSPVTSFKIYYDASGSFQELDSHTDLTNLEYQFSTANTGQQYGFTVSALNDVGEGAQSPAVYIYAAKVPEAPTGLAKVSADTG
jgi:titin